MSIKPTLMVVVAHPDDETFGMAGTLALYASRGVEVHVACATLGEAGDVNPKYLETHSSIGELREAELRCAANSLGVKHIHLLGYRDSGMVGWESNAHPQALTNTSVEDLSTEIVSLIRKVEPQVIITHDPNGGYFHLDHIHLHKAVTRAFHSAGDPTFIGCNLPAFQPQKLYFNTISRRFLRWLVKLMPLVGKDSHRFGKNGDIDLVKIVNAVIPVHTRINYSSVAEARAAAFRCYASQGGKEMNKGVVGLLHGWSKSHEVFMRAFPVPEGNQVEIDLFEGVVFS